MATSSQVVIIKGIKGGSECFLVLMMVVDKVQNRMSKQIREIRKLINYLLVFLQQS